MVLCPCKSSRSTLPAQSDHDYVPANNPVSSLRATASPHTVTLTGRALSFAVRLASRAQLLPCSSLGQAVLNAGAPAAQSYIAIPLAYLVHSAINSSAARCTTWFGTVNESRYVSVHGPFASISSRQYASFTYDCTCANASRIAYVDPDVFGLNRLCSRFYS